MGLPGKQIIVYTILQAVFYEGIIKIHNFIILYNFEKCSCIPVEILVFFICRWILLCSMTKSKKNSALFLGNIAIFCDLFYHVIRSNCRNLISARSLPFIEGQGPGKSEKILMRRREENAADRKRTGGNERC